MKQTKVFLLLLAMEIVIQQKIALKAYANAFDALSPKNHDKMRFCLVTYHIKVYQNENCCRQETLI